MNESKMKITIHRGANEIGGNCVEIATEKTRLIFDIGIPLSAMDDHLPCEHYEIEGLKGLYKNEGAEDSSEQPVVAVFISHYHADHFGLLLSMRDDVPIYASPLTKELIYNVDSPVNKKPYYKREICELVQNGSYPKWQDVHIGDITVSPWTVDHSAAGALGFVIFSGKETFFYSGDLRFHGKEKKEIMQELTTTLSKAAIDVMLLEGTNLGKEEKQILYRSEEDITEALKKSFKEQGEKLGIIYFSSQNADRFRSVHDACVNSNHTLVIDPYTARCLQAFHNHDESFPCYWENNIAILSMESRLDEKFLKRATGKKYPKHFVTLEEIYAHPERYVVKTNFYMQEEFFKHFKPEEMNLIYSQWEGYIKKNEELAKLHKQELVKVIHCSGHAYKEDLEKFIREVNPKELLPIHTEHSELMPNC